MRKDVVEMALEDSESRVSLIGTMTGQELHAFLDGYNWDDGFDPVRAVIRHPECELATALLAFWLAEPDLSTLPPATNRNQDHSVFVAELFDRISAGRYRVGALTFEPADFIANRLQRVKLEQAGLPPVFMTQLPVAGV